MGQNKSPFCVVSHVEVGARAGRRLCRLEDNRKRPAEETRPVFRVNGNRDQSFLKEGPHGEQHAGREDCVLQLKRMVSNANGGRVDLGPPSAASQAIL